MHVISFGYLSDRPQASRNHVASCSKKYIIIRMGSADEKSLSVDNAGIAMTTGLLSEVW